MSNTFIKKVTRPVLIFLLIIIQLLFGYTFAYAEEPEVIEEKTYYFLTDHLGSVDTVLDEEGSIVEQRDYLPYGNERSHIQEVDESQRNSYGFTGKELDEETDLYYYGARYYDPLIGRFISVDPWEGDFTNPQTLNKYSYAINNPLFFVDPTGMYIMATGEVEKGDALSIITKDLNRHYGTNYTYNDIAGMNNISDPNKIQTGATIRIGTLDGWRPPLSSQGINKESWDKLTQKQQQIMNVHKNFYQSNIPDNMNKLNMSEWKAMGETSTHNIGASGNLDFRGIGSRLGQQAIYNNIDGNLVTTPENMGTFDIEPPSVSNIYTKHLDVDVESWIEWGNSPADTTTKTQRIQGMAQTWEGRRGLDYLGYEY